MTANSGSAATTRRRRRWRRRRRRACSCSCTSASSTTSTSSSTRSRGSSRARSTRVSERCSRCVCDPHTARAARREDPAPPSLPHLTTHERRAPRPRGRSGRRTPPRATFRPRPLSRARPPSRLAKLRVTARAREPALPRGVQAQRRRGARVPLDARSLELQTARHDDAAPRQTHRPVRGPHGLLRAALRAAARRGEAPRRAAGPGCVPRARARSSRSPREGTLRVTNAPKKSARTGRRLRAAPRAALRSLREIGPRRRVRRERADAQRDGRSDRERVLSARRAVPTDQRRGRGRCGASHARADMRRQCRPDAAAGTAGALEGGFMTRAGVSSLLSRGSSRLSCFLAREPAKGRIGYIEKRDDAQRGISK